MTEALFNAMAGRAARLDNRTAQTRFGTVVDVDPNTGTCRVLIQPGKVLSPWMPYGAIAVGALQIQTPPSAGDQAAIDFLHGDSQQPVLKILTHSTQSPPRKSPFSDKPAQSGEMVILGPNGAALHIGQDGVWRIHGDLRVDGDVYDRYGSLDRLRGNFNDHSDTDSHGDKAGRNDHQDPRG